MCGIYLLKCTKTVLMSINSTLFDEIFVCSPMLDTKDQPILLWPTKCVARLDRMWPGVGSCSWGPPGRL